MTIRDLLIYGQEKLKKASIEEYENDSKVLLMYVLNFSYSDLIFRMNEEVTLEEENEFKRCILLRETHMPCQYITGVQEFMGYEFDTAKEVLIPRQETELLVEEALKLTKDKVSCKALDVCTGSGCIGISYNLQRREKGYQADEVCLVDISDYAITLSKQNIKKLNADCIAEKSDLFENVEGKYDIIMSNPPYIKSADILNLMEEVRDFEPHLALDGTENGLYYYDKIIKEARRYLYENGILIFEIGYDQYEDVRALFVDAGYENIHLIKDYAGLDRVLSATWPKNII